MVRPTRYLAKLRTTLRLHNLSSNIKTTPHSMWGCFKFVDMDID